MDRERLKQIIIEELVRAIAEIQTSRTASVAPRSDSSDTLPRPPIPSSPSVPTTKPGIVIFSGSREPGGMALDALAGLSVYGYSAEALLSFSFRQTQARLLPQMLRGVPVLPNPDDESAMERKIESSKWIVVVDASINTLNKVHLGIEDSAPSRAIAQAMRRGLGCVFLESTIAPLSGPESRRAELIRRFEGRGAFVTSPEGLPAAMHKAIRPPDEGLFKPPSPKPEVRLRVITREDVYDVASRGVTVFMVPAGAIITAEAIEDAGRRGLVIRREGE